MLPTKFQFIWPSGFRDFLEIVQPEITITTYGYSVSEVKIFTYVRICVITLVFIKAFE
jgi:hypothetical protein